MTAHRDPVTRFVEAREQLISTAQPGLGAAYELTRITDEAVSALAEAAFAGVTERWAVLATGGYGCQRLLPFSDVDLLIIVQKRTRRSDAAAKSLLYPLWDAGLEVGHAVRTPAEQRAACKRDFQTLTAILPGRVIAGDRSLGDAVRRAVIDDAASRRSAIVRALSARARTGSPFDLWPDLKNGAGGQRDVDELDWRALLLGESLPDLAREREVLCAARWALHVAVGRGATTVSPDQSHVPSSELHRALGTIAATLAVRRGAVDPSVMSGAHLTSEAFLEACDAGAESFEALAYAAFHGALDGFVPGLSALMTVRRPALGHRYTVGAHCVLAALSVAEVLHGDPLAASLCSPTCVPVAIAAALAHDAGKAVPGPGHAARSADPAASAARALVGSEEAASQAAWLAREHLLLSSFAERADIDDERVVAACAARIPSRDLLGPLYLVTAADHKAVGSGAWDSWHASLVQTLVRRLDAAFSGDSPIRTETVRAEEARAQAAALLSSEPDALVALSRFPSGSLFDRAPADVAEDARAIARLARATRPATVETCVSAGPVQGTFSVRIATSWRPRLLEEIAGCCTLTGLDILDARLLADAGELTLTSVLVRSLTGVPLLADTWARLDRLLGRALADELDLASRLASALPARKPPSVFRLEWNVGEPTCSVLHVVTDDSPGLLYALARAVHDAGLVILSARAVVRNGAAIDTLRLVDGDGAPIRTPGLLGHLSVGIRETLAAQ
ncbi:MAG: hypothetical protein H5T75_04175 [Coriobacteriia bacterium]|nr:hypothetical protein [Coriobacteriia bacterium]